MILMARVQRLSMLAQSTWKVSATTSQRLSSVSTVIWFNALSTILLLAISIQMTQEHSLSSFERQLGALVIGPSFSIGLQRSLISRRVHPQLDIIAKVSKPSLDQGASLISLQMSTLSQRHSHTRSTVPSRLSPKRWITSRTSDMISGELSSSTHTSITLPRPLSLSARTRLRVIRLVE